MEYNNLKLLKIGFQQLLNVLKLVESDVVLTGGMMSCRHIDEAGTCWPPSSLIEHNKPSDGLAERWYCVYAQPNKERFAALNLERQSYSCFLPTVIKTTRHARRVTKVRSALFPRYLFIKLDPQVQAWRPIRSTFGVSALVMEDDRPKPVPLGVVENLQEAVSQDGYVDFRHEAKVGQRVRLLSGPFANLVGRLEHLDEKGRVSVLLDILGGQRVVTTNKASLLPIAS